MKIIKSIEDAQEFAKVAKLWDDYVIDIFPENPEDISEKEIELKNKICEIINDWVSKKKVLSTDEK